MKGSGCYCVNQICDKRAETDITEKMICHVYTVITVDDHIDASNNEKDSVKLFTVFF